jgi:1-acyl-sn-glycerol-3-phosphate acyltransferase
MRVVLSIFAALYYYLQMRKISLKILEYFGWKLLNNIELPDKCVICVAPHTSNWDFLWGNLVAKAFHVQSHFLIKKEWFVFPLNIFMHMMGGIPVDRSQKTSMTDALAELFHTKSKFYLAVAPEGTRKLTYKWKKGFYFIAHKAQVPIVLAFIDYEKKELGFGKLFYTTGNIEQDMLEMMSFYKDKVGRFPERFHISEL